MNEKQRVTYLVTYSTLINGGMGFGNITINCDKKTESFTKGDIEAVTSYIKKTLKNQGVSVDSNIVIVNMIPIAYDEEIDRNAGFIK